MNPARVFGGLRGATLARTYASAAAVSVPKKLYGVNGRYATALYLSATKQGASADVEKELLTVQELLRSSEQFKQFVNDPFVKREHTSEVFKSLSQKGGFTSTTSNFFGTIIANNRTRNLEGIIDAFCLLMREQRGEVVATITTAEAMSAKEKEDVERTLKSKFLQDSGKVEIKTQVNPNIIGGVIVEIGERYMDLSIATRVQRYSEMLQNVSV